MERTRVYLLDPCYECREYLGSSHSVINHLRNVHGIEIEERQSNQKRPPSNAYIYEKNLTDDSETHFACPSCWFHCPESFSVLSHHMLQAHVYPATKNEKKGDNGSNPMKELAKYKTESINKIKGKTPSIQGASQEEINEKKNEIFGVLDDMIANFKKLFSTDET